ncbi:hypothetical protein BDV12DRAFT_186421 [Aspergillus spectabilis]
MTQFDIAVHGRKRPAGGELDDQPLAKKFGRLQIARIVPRLSEPNDAMMLDDTKNRVYIHDLDRELAESELLDGPLIILPGLEQKLSMPKMLVSNTNCQCNEIVLYREPESLSIPRDKDQVRRALMETRERTRLRQSIHERNIQKIDGNPVTKDCLESEVRQQDDDLADKMDIDVEI